MTGRNPTDRGKRGTKRNVLTDQRAIPFENNFLIARRKGPASTSDIEDILSEYSNKQFLFSIEPLITFTAFTIIK